MLRHAERSDLFLSAVYYLEHVEKDYQFFDVGNRERPGLNRVGGMGDRVGEVPFPQVVPQLVDVASERLDLGELCLVETVNEHVYLAAVLRERCG